MLHAANYAGEAPLQLPTSEEAMEAALDVTRQPEAVGRAVSRVLEHGLDMLGDDAIAPRLQYAFLTAGSCIRPMANRTTIVLDQKELARVRRVLGTTGIKETVERAFDEILAMELRKRHVERLVSRRGSTSLTTR